MNKRLVGIFVLECIKLAGNHFRRKPITKQSDFQLQVPLAPHKEYYLQSDSELAWEAPEEKPLSLRQSPNEFTESEVTPERATSIVTGCIPCAINHMATCTGLLNEGMRFAGTDGVTSDEVIDRVGMCLTELNAMERVDLRPEMVANLPDWEKELVDQVLLASRSTRHKLEAMSDVKTLEQAAATTQETHKEIWREYIKRKAANLTPEEIASSWEAIQERLLAKIEELEPDEEEEDEP